MIDFINKKKKTVQKLRVIVGILFIQTPRTVFSAGYIQNQGDQCFGQLR